MQHGINKSNMDLTVNPGTNFHQYATGHWLDNNPRNPEYSSWSNFSMLSDKLDDQIKDLIHGLMDEECAPDSLNQKVRDLYALYCDTERLNREGYTPLLPLLGKIDSFQNRQELIDYIAFRHSALFFHFGFGTNPKDSGWHMLHIDQMIGNPDEYLSDNPRIVEVRGYRQQFMRNILKLMDVDEAQAQKMVDAYWECFAELAKESMSRVDQRDPVKTCNIMTVDELQALTPTFDWNRYLKIYGLEDAGHVNVRCISATVKACEMFMQLPLDTLKNLLKLRLMCNCAPLFSEAFCDECHDLHKKIAGDCEQEPREKRAISFVTGTMHDVIAQVYVEKYFPKENKDRMLALVERLRASFAERIEKQPWMSDETKRLAQAKLSSMKVKIGFPDKWDDLSGIVVDPKLSLFDNCENIGEFFWQDAKKRYFNKPVDKDEWHMSPITVNACYSPVNNDITFPAAILQAPFFDMEADDAANLGAIGVVISHEMTHGFDDSGRKFDVDGNLNNWWTEEDAANFADRTKQLVKLFDEFSVRGNKINGQLTLGENIADLGGLNVAWDAYQMTEEAKANQSIDGFTPAQRFFISYGTVWRNNSRDKYLERQVVTDVHSPAEARVNRALGSMPHFYEAFDIQPGDKMYIAPEERAKIW